MFKNPMWSPLLPIGGTVQNKAGQLVKINRDEIGNVVAETKRYYSDLESQGRLIHRPLLKTDTPHKDSGERYGDLVDAAITRDPKNLDRECLALKMHVSDEAKQRIESGEMAYGSIQIDMHTDPQTGEVYGPMIIEVSPTAKPKITNYSLSDLLTPSALNAVGLALSEGETMDIEKQIAGLLASIETLTTKVGGFEARFVALETPTEGKEAEPTTEEVPAAEAEPAQPVAQPATPAPVVAPVATQEPVAIAASEDAINARVDALVAQRLAQHALPTTELAAPGTLAVAASESKKKKKDVPTLDVLKRKTGLTGLEACKAHESIKAGDAKLEDYTTGK